MKLISIAILVFAFASIAQAQDVLIKLAGGTTINVTRTSGDLPGDMIMSIESDGKIHQYPFILGTPFPYTYVGHMNGYVTFSGLATTSGGKIAYVYQNTTLDNDKNGWSVNFNGLQLHIAVVDLLPPKP